VKTIDMYRLLKSGVQVVPFSYFGNDVNNIPDSAVGILINDGGVIKRCRWVGNFVGNDVVTYPVPSSLDGQSSDCEVSFLYKADGNPSADSNIWGQSSAPTNNIRIVHMTNGRIQARLRNANGSVFSDITSANVLPVGEWCRIDFVISSNSIVFSFCGVSSTPVSLVGFTPNVSTITRLYGGVASGTRTFARMSTAKINRLGAVVLDSPINNGAGTIISDISGNSNNGSLTDSSPLGFWQKDLVP
jgi:hypothetical protein